MIRLAPLLVLLGSCASAPASSDRDGVVASVVGMYGAFKDRNLDGVAPFMTEGSTCYDVYTSRLLVGRKAVLDHFAAILARHGQGEKWEAEIKDMEVAVSGDVAVATYKISTKAEGAHMLAAVTHVFRRQGGRWLATHLHRSWNSPPPK
jgi:ketosteroid isomerase-like protein